MALLLFVPEGRPYIALAALALALSAVSFVYKCTRSPLAKIPGPWYSKFTDVVLAYQWFTGKRAKYVHALHLRYGPVVRIAPSEVDVTDIPSVKEIHTVKATYPKSGFYQTFTGLGQEDIFSTSNVHFHRRHRKLLSGGFSDASLKTYLPIIENRVNLVIERIGQEMQTRGAADVCKWWLFMATDVIGELTFGESFRMLELGEKNEYSRNLEKAAVVGAKRSTFPTLTKLAYYGVPIPGFGDSNQVTQANIKYAKEALQRYQRLVAKDPEHPVPTLFTKLFKGEEEGEMTFKEILDEAQTFIIAGSDTTALTMTYLVWRVSTNPEIRDRLVGELRQLPENYQDCDLQSLPYLNQIIEESLRLHSAAPSGLPRTVPPEGATLRGFFLPGGSTVCTQAYSLHRDPNAFPNAEEFDPSRWAKPTREMRDAFMPFGGGSRICIGLHLARIELRLATARFFLTFPHAKMSTLEGMSDDDMEQMLFFLAPPKGKRCLLDCS